MPLNLPFVPTNPFSNTIVLNTYTKQNIVSINFFI